MGRHGRPRPNLSGKSFGYLYVIEQAPSLKRSRMWRCKCKCGKETIVNTKSLHNGDTKSCGCLKVEQLHFNTNAVGLITMNYWSQVIQGASQRELSFNLTREQAWDLFEKQGRRCALTGRPIDFGFTIKSRKMPNRGRNSVTASLDRIDCNYGYEISNVQWVHKDVNIAKHKKTNQDFVGLCRQVVEYHEPRDNNATVCVSGGMDPPHAGHIAMILEAAKHGKVVIILNSDEWLIRKKGYRLMPWVDRKAILGAIRGVIDVVPVKDDDNTVCEALARVRPTFFAKGGDRTPTTTPAPEIMLCERLGIRVLWGIGGGKIQSSSSIVNEAFDQLRGAT